MSNVAVRLAQKQLDAYNSQNIEEFLSVYHKDVIIMDFPSNEIVYTGIEKMRDRYSHLFTNNPNQHAQLRSRVAKGNVVIDHEYVTGRANGVEVEAVAMYEVQGEKIIKVWFVK